MTEITVPVYAPSGEKVGEFRNPEVQILDGIHYILKGKFYEPDGTLAQRVEFNPQVLPYTADLGQIPDCAHKTLLRVYVERGRQPIEMFGVAQVEQVRA